MLSIKKRLLSVLSAAALAVAPACLLNASAAEGADVTVKLGTAEELVQFKTEWDNGDYADVNLTVELTGDIDMTGVEWTGLYKFKGTFDGKGYTISNMAITGSDINEPNFSKTANLGFFNTIAGGTVKNVTFDSCTVTELENFSNGFVGIIAGRDETDSVTLENCHVTNCEVFVNSWFVGGLIGEIGDIPSAGVTRPTHTIKNCSVTDTLVRGSMSTTSTVGQIGGLVGGAYSTEFIDCYSNADVQGSSSVGGLIGYLRACRLINCGSEAAVIAFHHSGGIAGAALVSEIINCYSAATVIGTYNLGGIVGSISGAEGEGLGFANGSNVFRFSNCISAADIESSENSGGSSCSGLLAGTINSASGTYLVENAYCDSNSSFTTVNNEDLTAASGTELDIISDFSDSETLKSILDTLNSYEYENNDVELKKWAVRSDGSLVFASYAVTFVDENDNVLDVVYVAEGDSFDPESAPEIPQKEGFTGAWDADLSAVSESCTVKAVYTEISDESSDESSDVSSDESSDTTSDLSSDESSDSEQDSSSDDTSLSDEDSASSVTDSSAESETSSKADSSDKNPSTGAAAAGAAVVILAGAAAAVLKKKS
ncbi:hypothetical protein [Ruminococcus sp. Marseille-P6503]|uniref:hypothetical protein n=1 Tax=Ruminococcus sp. Marseille-P6503 TaxID=2364796 RepID=UPI000F528B96|nr:hypothetical protein [Ruminococcus sp. Marseille-P6503]